MERLLEDPPEVDVVILEGTRVPGFGAAEGSSMTEDALEEEVMRFLKQTEGLALLLYPPQNIDRLVTLFKAAIRVSRTFVYDLYAADVTHATGRATIPQAEWPEVRVYLPASQLRKVREARAFERTKRILEQRIYPSEIGRQPSRYALLFRQEMGSELERAGCLLGARALWSMSTAYLQSSREAAWLAKKGIPLEVAHTSGHASAADLRRIAAAFAPARIVPIHTEAADRFADAFDNVEVHVDGEWWEV